MAKLTVRTPDALIAKLTRLGNKTDQVCEKALKAGAQVAEKAVSSNLSAVIGKDTKQPSRSTGELQESLGISPVKVDEKGNYDVKVGFAEPRSGGGVNAKIANILEYGKAGQPPKPFLKPAKSKARRQITAAITDTLEREMNNI